MSPKRESVVNTHPISVHTEFEFDCMKPFSDNGQKPPFSLILWPLEGQNLANVAQQQINSEHTLDKCAHQVWIGLCEYFFK